MNLRFIVITQKTPDWLEAAGKEYEKRLTRYSKIKTVKVKSPEKAGKAIDAKSPLILIGREGDLISSEALADLITKAEVSGISSVNILSGEGAEVFADRADRIFSISPVNMNPDLVSVVTLEQIYRAYKIISGEKYHK